LGDDFLDADTFLEEGGVDGGVAVTVDVADFLLLDGMVIFIYDGLTLNDFFQNNYSYRN